MDILIFVIPVVIIVAALWLCKKYNFSILPNDFKGKKPTKFKMPKLSRVQKGNSYKWESSSFDSDESSDDEPPHKNKNSKYKKLSERNMYD
jgi:hypothetical protein